MRKARPLDLALYDLERKHSAHFVENAHVCRPLCSDANSSAGHIVGQTSGLEMTEAYKSLKLRYTYHGQVVGDDESSEKFSLFQFPQWRSIGRSFIHVLLIKVHKRSSRNDPQISRFRSL